MRLIRNPKYKKSCLSERDPNSLPNELLLAIFKDFPITDLLTRIGPVCSRWYTLARSIVQRKTTALLLRSSGTTILPPSEELSFFSVDTSSVQVLSVNFSAPDFGSHLGSTFRNVDTLIVYSSAAPDDGIPSSEIATLLSAWSSSLRTVKLLVSRDSLFSWPVVWAAIETLCLVHLSINAHYLAVEGRSVVFDHLQEFNYGQAFVKSHAGTASPSLDIFNMLSRLSAAGPLPPSIGLFTNGLMQLRCDLASLNPGIRGRIVRLSERIAAHCFRASQTNLVQLAASTSTNLTSLSLYLNTEKDYQSYYHLLARYAPSLNSITFTVQSFFTGNIFNFAVTQRAMNAALPKEVSPAVQSITFFCYIEKRSCDYFSQMASILLERGRLLFPNLIQVVVHDQTKNNPIPMLQSSMVL